MSLSTPTFATEDDNMMMRWLKSIAAMHASGSGSSGVERLPTRFPDMRTSAKVTDFTSVLLICSFTITAVAAVCAFVPSRSETKSDEDSNSRSCLTGAIKRLLRICFILGLGSVVLLCRCGNFWSVADCDINTYYDSYHTGNKNVYIEVHIGLQGFNVTLALCSKYHKQAMESKNFSFTNFTNNKAKLTMLDEIQKSKPSSDLILADRLAKANKLASTISSVARNENKKPEKNETDVVVLDVFGNKSVTFAKKFLELNTQLIKLFHNTSIDVQAKTRSKREFKNVKKLSDMLGNIQEMAILKSDLQTDPIGRLALEADIGYNERFGWVTPAHFARDYQASKEKGLPSPLMDVVEYFSHSGPGILAYQKKFRTAGYYASYFAWWAFTCWILSLFLFHITIRLGGYALIATGSAMLLSNGLYIKYIPSHGNFNIRLPFATAHEHWNNGSLNFHLGWCFWLNLAGATASFVVGVYIVIGMRYLPYHLGQSLFSREKVRNSVRRMTNKCRLSEITISSGGRLSTQSNTALITIPESENLDELKRANNTCASHKLSKYRRSYDNLAGRRRRFKKKRKNALSKSCNSLTTTISHKDSNWTLKVGSGEEEAQKIEDFGLQSSQRRSSFDVVCGSTMGYTTNRMGKKSMLFVKRNSLNNSCA